MGIRALLWCAVLIVTVAASPAGAQSLPTEAEYKHLGPATCATSVCHGKVTPDKTANVWLNEYRIWARDDAHSQAYAVLRNEESQAIAAKLGLSSATTAKICLDCHADNIPAAQRGEKFQISDGVGCEACHGGAEQWIKSHSEEDATHAENLSLGMYPTEKPVARAKLCLSCHVGTSEKYANHDIMAAGHPRMSFELVVYTVNQPAHYNVDEDYIKRKGQIKDTNMWTTGMLVKAKRELSLLQSNLFIGHGVFPELAFFDCHACHHAMNERRWSPTILTRGMPVGAVRLNDSSLAMLAAITSVIAPDISGKLQDETRALHLASVRGKDALMAQAGALQSYLDKIMPTLAAHQFTDSQIKAIRVALLKNAAAGEYRDFTSAEQAFMGVVTLSYVLEQADQFQTVLDEWYATVEKEQEFSPSSFASVARRFRGKL